MKPGDVLWDIGADVGAYAMYAALGEGVRVLAFEPNPLTFHNLARNTINNGLAARLTPLCIALARDTRLGALALSGEEAGSVFNKFSTEGTSSARSIGVCGMSMDDFARVFSPPAPTHIKIDVDNIEEEIVAGGADILSRPTVRSVLIELDSEDPAGISRISAMLQRAGLVATASERCVNPRWYNQIFTRPD